MLVARTAWRGRRVLRAASSSATHFPPVTMTTLPFKSGRSLSGVNVFENRPIASQRWNGSNNARVQEVVA